MSTTSPRRGKAGSTRSWTRAGDDPLSDGRAAAVDRAIEEAGLVGDPHRAIDWLSTFPQIVLVAVGERP
jgi:hypothetical protein